MGFLLDVKFLALMELEMDESLGWLTNLGSLKAERMVVWIMMVPDWE